MWMFLLAGAPTKLRTPFQRRLTAANYRYFMRGANEKAAPGDVQVQLPDQKKLAPYDQTLRRFECVPAALLSSNPARSLNSARLPQLTPHDPHSMAFHSMPCRVSIVGHGISLLCEGLLGSLPAAEAA